MGNPYYVRSVRKERELVRNARKAGRIALRSAASKSPIDVVDIDPHTKRIWLIQVKTGMMTPNQILKLEKEMEFLNGEFKVKFQVCHFP